MTRGWFSGPGIGVLDARYLMLDCTNDPLTAGLEINAATAGEPVLILQTTDDDNTNPILLIQESSGNELMRIDSDHELNTFVGEEAGRINDAAGGGTSSTFIGSEAGWNNTTGDRNTLIGAWAGHEISLGADNVCVGSSAGQNITTGIGNFCLGRLTGTALLANGSCVLIGLQAGQTVAGVHNVCIGTSAGRYLTSAIRNVYIGSGAGYSGGIGDYNVGIGSEAGFNLVGSYNVCIGYRAGYNEAGSNKLYISNSNTATPLVYGEFDTWRLAFGNQYAVDKYGQLTHASGQFAAVGDAQDSRYVCRLAQASHAVNTWYALYPDGGTTPERLTIAAETGWTIHVIVVGITAAAAQQWGYEIIGLLERDGANNTTLAGQTVRTIFESDANYDAQLAADDANEALEVQVRRTGGVDYDVRWTASAKLIEVTYPA